MNTCAHCDGSGIDYGFDHEGAYEAPCPRCECIACGAADQGNILVARGTYVCRDCVMWEPERRARISLGSVRVRFAE